MSESSLFGILTIIVLIVFLSMGGGLKSNPNAGGSVYNPSLATSTGTSSSSSVASSSQGSAGSPQPPSPPSATSTYSGLVRLNYSYAWARSAAEQYVRIDTTYALKESVSITGWRLYSPVTGRSMTIGLGSSLPLAGVSGNEKIVLNPGDYAYVVSGFSPEGVSFRDNKCTGYFAANQRFYPGVSGSCPRPANFPYRSVANPNGLDDACADYVSSLPYCSIVPAVPQRHAGACAEYVAQHFSYSGCVQDFKNDSGFYLNHWFVYANRSEAVWKPSHETIVLYDADGKFVDSVSY